MLRHVPELPGTRNRNMHRNKGKATLPWGGCMCRAEEKPDIHGGSGPQHNLPVGQCPAATTEREQGSVESI